MREFNLEEFFDAQISVTIDRSSPDPALDNARLAFPGHGSHTGNAEAVDRILQLLGGGLGTCIIVGRGDKGQIVTNANAYPRTNNDWMHSGNRDFWDDFVINLKDHVTVLKLYACNVAAGNSGSSFLSHIANLIKAPVTGPTGFLFPTAAGTISAEPGTQWPIAHPGRALTPIPAPVNFSPDEINRNMLMNLNDKPDKQTVPLDAVTEITYFSGRFKKGPGVSLAGQDAISVLSLIKLEQPFNSGGPPLAMVTGHLDVTFRDDQGAEVTREFVIYNNRLLWETRGDAYYYTNPAFETIVSSL